MSRSALPAHPWLPLGSAQIIDWKYLGSSAATRGATAWTGRVGGEPVLIRTWSSDNTTTFEFNFLSYEELTGSIVVTTDRSEPARLRLEVSIDVDQRLGYTDALELVEHSRTGLHGATVRTVDARLGPTLDDLVDPPLAVDAEILEYAPESALGTSCGLWIAQLLTAVKARLLDGDSPAEAAAIAARAPQARLEPPEPQAQLTPPSDPEPVPDLEPEFDSEPAYAPEPIVEEDLEPDYDFEPEPTPVPEPPPEPRRKDKPAARRTRENIDPPARKAPRPPPPEPESPDKLLATTNTGDSWEVVDEETFIGRSKQCAIVLKSQRVSRKHASVTRDDDGFYINDLGAANGIWAGTEKIDRERIEHGAEYIIGDVLMTFHHG